MRVVVGVHHFGPNHVAGAEREAERFSRGLLARGHEVQVVCVDQIDAGPADGVAWVDESYLGLPLRRLSFDLGRAPDRFRWEYDNPWIGDHFRTLFREQPPDVFLLAGGYLLSASPLFAAAEAGVPSIVRLMDFWYLCPRATFLRSDGALSSLPIQPATCARCLAEERRRYRIPGRLFPGFMRLFWRLRPAPADRVRRRSDFLRRALDCAAAILSPSQTLFDFYARAGVDRKKIHFLRQGVDLPEKAWAPRAADGELRLGFIGTLAHAKGAHVLVKALRALPAARVRALIYGDLRQHPGYVEELRRLAAGDERIELRGRYQDGNGLAGLMSQVDAMVVPSLTYENSPNAILESFAYGLPVIASNQGGMAELVRHEESGLLFRAGDAAALARQIARLAGEPSLLPVLRSGVPPVKAAAEEVAELEAWCRRAAGLESWP